MTTARQSRETGRFTGRHMLIVMVLFFGVIIGINITMAVMASRSWTGLVVKNSYVASQNFNKELLAAREQSARGWQTSLAYQSGEVVFTLKDRNSQPVVLDGLTLNYGRPAYDRDDVTAPLTHVSGGTYKASAKLAPGIWTLKIAGGVGENQYRRDSRLVVADDGKSGREE